MRGLRLLEGDWGVVRQVVPGQALKGTGPRRRVTVGPNRAHRTGCQGGRSCGIPERVVCSPVSVVGPRAPLRMNQTLHHLHNASLLAESRQPDAASAIEVRPVTTLPGFHACVELQEEVWGPGYTDRVPASLLQVATYVGGLVLGAFRGNDELIGMVFGLAGFENEERVHWSHMLGVRDSARNLGIGRLLKESQRDLLAQRGVHRMSWTFDPLVAKNAFLNLNKLGARVVGYVDNMYGTTTSPLHHGAPTDRLIVSVDTRVAAPRHTVPDVQPPRQPALTLTPRMGDVAVDLAAPPPSLWIEIPSDVQDVSKHAPEAVAAWRHAVRKHFTWALANDYEVQALQRDVHSLRSFYLLSRGEHR